MQKVRQIPWLRIGGESVAIVVSILLAFAINAWWVDATNRRTQSAELTRLHEELTRIRGEFDSQTDSHEEAHAAVAELFEIVHGYLDRDEPLTVQNELLTAATNTVTVDLAMPVLDGLVLSGRVDSIQSQDVVATIAGWRRALGELVEVEQTARGLANSHLVPALIERANMGDVLARKNMEGSTTVLVDDELEGHLGSRYRVTGLIVNRLDEVQMALESVIQAIERAQGLSI